MTVSWSAEEEPSNLHKVRGCNVEHNCLTAIIEAQIVRQDIVPMFT